MRLILEINEGLLYDTIGLIFAFDDKKENTIGLPINVGKTLSFDKVGKLIDKSYFNNNMYIGRFLHIMDFKNKIEKYFL